MLPDAAWRSLTAMILLPLLLVPAALAFSLNRKGRFIPSVTCARDGTLIELTSIQVSPLTKLTEELVASAWDEPAVAECRELGGMPLVTFTCNYLANTNTDWFYWKSRARDYPLGVTRLRLDRKTPSDEVFRPIVTHGNIQQPDWYTVEVLAMHDGGPPDTTDITKSHRAISIIFPVKATDFEFVWTEHDAATKKERELV